jgi:hypothetical protein
MVHKITRYYFLKFQFLTAKSMKFTVFWDVMPCSLIHVYRRFGYAYFITDVWVIYFLINLQQYSAPFGT